MEAAGGGDRARGAPTGVASLALPRSAMMYAASFPRRAGFPGGHLLNRLGPGRRPDPPPPPPLVLSGHAASLTPY